MRKWEENSNPTGKKAENEINEFSQMNDSWCWDPSPWFCVVPELQCLQVNVQCPLVWNWSLPGSSYNSLTVSLNRLKQAGSPVSRAWEKCEYSGKLSLHTDFLCKNQQKCVGDRGRRKAGEKKGGAILKTPPNGMKLLSQPWQGYIDTIFPPQLRFVWVSGKHSLWEQIPPKRIQVIWFFIVQMPITGLSDQCWASCCCYSPWHYLY